MCFAASDALVKIPVDSTTTWAPTEAQPRAAGSRSAKTLMFFPPTVIEPSPALTATGSRPKIESYFSKCAKVAVGVKSLIPTISIFGLFSAARKKLRPMRPKPLIPTFTVIT